MKKQSYLVFIAYEFFSILPWRLGIENTVFTIMCFLLTIPYLYYRYRVLRHRKIVNTNFELWIELGCAVLFNFLIVISDVSIDTILYPIFQLLSILPTIVFDVIYFSKVSKNI